MTLSRSVVGCGCVVAALVVGSLVLRPTRLIAQSGAESSAVPQAFDRVPTYASDSPEVKIGFKIAPVRLTFRLADRELVGRGSYLVNSAGGCSDCHTSPSFEAGGDPYLGQPEKVNKAGYLAGGALFGPFRSRNLTPNQDGLPAGLAWTDFHYTMTTGWDFSQEHPQISSLLQVMPWPAYSKMKTRDLRAIYTYLKAIPSVPPPAAAAQP